jgi:hypothetical protein
MAMRPDAPHFYCFIKILGFSLLGFCRFRVEDSGLTRSSSEKWNYRQLLLFRFENYIQYSILTFRSKLPSLKTFQLYRTRSPTHASHSLLADVVILTPSDEKLTSAYPSANCKLNSATSTNQNLPSKFWKVTSVDLGAQ